LQEELRTKLHELTAQTDRVQQHLDDKATRAEVTAAIREEREIVIMPLFRQSALLQEEENKRVLQRCNQQLASANVADLTYRCTSISSGFSLSVHR
jgi:hypothetical protein